MEAEKIVEWGLYAILSGFGAVITSTLRKLTTSVEELNVQIAKLVEKTLNHEKTLDRHAQRIEYLEREKR